MMNDGDRDTIRSKDRPKPTELKQEHIHTHTQSALRLRSIDYVELITCRVSTISYNGCSLHIAAHGAYYLKRGADL